VAHVPSCGIRGLYPHTDFGGRPAFGRCRHMDAPWWPYAGRGPTGQSATPLKSPRYGAAAPHSFLPPRSPSRRKPSHHCHLCSSELACAHHRTTIHQISPNAPPCTPIPPPPLNWANRVEVRAHCRIRHRLPRTILTGVPRVMVVLL
jgi:hypothetical protein